MPTVNILPVRFVFIRFAFCIRPYYATVGIGTCFRHILGIIDSKGQLVVQYDHTAYGKVTVLKDTVGIANINPFRYKGYYYDQESGMYYCHTRYYVPEWGRWLNADSALFLDPKSLNGMNMFIYCSNNPIMLIDESGTLSKTASWILIGLGVAVAVALIVFASAMTGGAAGMLAVSATTQFAASALVGAGSGFLVGVGGSLVEQTIQHKGDLSKIDPEAALTSGVQGAVVGAVSGMLGFFGGHVGATYGQEFGYRLATHIVNGTSIGSVFGGASLLFNAGEFVGGAIGAIAGVAAGNEIGNRIFGISPGIEKDIQEGFGSWVESFIESIFKVLRSV